MSNMVISVSSYILVLRYSMLLDCAIYALNENIHGTFENTAKIKTMVKKENPVNKVMEGNSSPNEIHAVLI